MTLRGQPPTAGDKRLKLMMFGPAGVGKTTAAIQMPKPYLIDCEGGARHYGAMLAAAGGVSFESNDLEDVMLEVNSLLTERHDYLTLIIDPFTMLYQTELERGEVEVGSDFGRHYGWANKRCAQLFHVLDLIDMNVVVTCHAKNEYGKDMAVIGSTFDAWKKLDYRFDLVLELQRYGQARKGFVRKTRLDGFPDGDLFDWSFDELATRCPEIDLKQAAEPVAMASDAQIVRMQHLVGDTGFDVSPWLKKAGATTFGDMTADVIAKCISHLETKDAAE